MMTLMRRPRRTELAVPAGNGDPWDRLFDQMMFPWATRVLGRVGGHENGVFSPDVDITQNDDEIVLRAELPGVAKDDIEITILSDTLTLKGSKKSETDGKEGDYQYAERRYGEFYRTFELPDTVDTAKVVARFKDGVLELHLPLAEKAKPRKIEVTLK